MRWVTTSFLQISGRTKPVWYFLNQVHIFLQSAALQSPDPELPGGLWIGEGYSKPSDSLWTTLVSL